MPRNPNDLIDIHVGSRMKIRRILLGFSQSALSSLVGLSFQQIQKYETGANRVSASRLYRFSKALDVSVGYFFEGLDAEGVATFKKDSITDIEAANLLRVYRRITDAGTRRRALEILKVLGPHHAKTRKKAA